MEIIKLINNNIVSAFDDKNREVIVMGRGLGFGAAVGQPVDVTKVQKIFRMDSDDETKRLQDVLTDVPLERVQLANRIINDAEKIITNKMQRGIYITLIDHINFAIDRYHQNIEFSNPLLMDIKRFYPKEFMAGKNAVNFLNNELSIELSDDEAASIALHFINAELGVEMPETINAAKMIQSIVKIVKYHYNMELDEASLNYERFITHLKFFTQRIVTQKGIDSNEKELNDIIKKQYPNAYHCADKIKKYIEKEYQTTISDDEMTYLTVHIKRITTSKEE